MRTPRCNYGGVGNRSEGQTYLNFAVSAKGKVEESTNQLCAKMKIDLKK
ncbi:hypothetical protein RSSM_03861 [Rhodopirellula sallentina SM41]|uniref:Uncharacterized protein n=1 Tax=Rhodopirellula sallentina SM41 TaxID=1263870 RepID=M5TZX8_9BACT|nr:hypothetical protein RSSM_03861 [Rhodopirellula sallentina SM41]